MSGRVWIESLISLLCGDRSDEVQKQGRESKRRARDGTKLAFDFGSRSLALLCSARISSDLDLLPLGSECAAPHSAPLIH